MSKRDVYVPNVLRMLADAIERERPREDCTTCRYGEYGNPRCYSCAVNYESHYVQKGKKERPMSDDLIKREDAIKAIEELPNAYNGWSDAYDKAYIIGALEEIPSADRPQGEWKPKNHHTDYCSECGFEETQWRTAEYKFCPNCGAPMKGIDDE